ncbi:MAG: hypothetical protein GC149_03160 [Gammaproteobacteria bacterium]|nr:hypothetical protein [Gammaproteobacteria bacterium]
MKLLVNKVPMRRICEVLDIRPATLYNKIAYLAEVSTAFVEEHELKLQHSEPPKARIYISIDRQDYSLNWGTHLDRRNIQLGAIGAVDNDSGYVLAMQLNFDSSLNAEDVEADAIKRGDYDLPPPYRHYARLWLRREYDASDCTLLHSDDTEVVEHVDPAIKGPHSGMQVHLEYTQYALFLHLKKLLQGVQKLRFFMDRDPGLDGACLAAFVEEVQQRRADAFLVQSIKTLTMQKKKLLIAHKQREFDKFCVDHPMLKKAEAKHEWVQEQLESYLAEKTDSQTWFNYPFPDMAEPGKTLLHLTDYGDYPLDHLARLYMRASLRGIDRFFMQVRRRLSILERPIATANNANRRWHGYAAYSPLVVEQVLRIFRAYYNYCLVGEDGETPAMRLKLINHLVPLEVLAGSSFADVKN